MPTLVTDLGIHWLGVVGFGAEGRKEPKDACRGLMKGDTWEQLGGGLLEDSTHLPQCLA